jgi:hypothetical protein
VDALAHLDPAGEDGSKLLACPLPTKKSANLLSIGINGFNGETDE